MGVIVLCAEAEGLQRLQRSAPPGLDLASLEKSSWLMTFADAREARDFTRFARAVDEVWVVSSVDVSAINLAAAIKGDNASRNVYLVALEASGSLLSCTRAAGIDGVLSCQEILCRIVAEKRRRDDAWNAAGDLGDTMYGMPHGASGFMQADAPASGGASRPDVDGHDRVSPSSDVRDCKEHARDHVQGAGPEPSAEGAPAKTAPPRVRRAQKADSKEDPFEKPAAPAETPAPAMPPAPAETPAPAKPPAPTAPPDPAAQWENRPQRRGSAFVMSVVSGSGGVGKSTVATVSAFCAQRRGYRTLLLDCDLQFGDVHYFLGIDDPLRIEEVLEDPSKVGTLDAQGEMPALVASLGHLEEADSLAHVLPQAIEMLSEHFDVIVINTGSSWAEHHAVLLESSSRVLFLVDQRASSIRSCRRALDLCKRCGIASGPFAYALNRCSRGSLLSSVDASCALQGVHVSEIKDGGSVVEELLGAGMALELLSSRNDLCASVDRLLDEMLPGEDPFGFGAQRKVRRGRGRASRNAHAMRRKQRAGRMSRPAMEVPAPNGVDQADGWHHEREGAKAASMMQP